MIRLATRRERLQRQTEVTGLDFAAAREETGRTVVELHFLHRLVGAGRTEAELEVDLRTLGANALTITGPGAATPADVGIDATGWETVGSDDEERDILLVTLSPAAGSSRYEIHVDHPRIDSEFSSASFRFALDRIEELQEDDQDLVTGIDYVDVSEDQRTIDVHFLRSPSSLAGRPPGRRDLTEDFTDTEQVRIVPTEPGDPEVSVSSIEWVGDDGDGVVPDGDILQVSVDAPGGFSPYLLFLDDDEAGEISRIDPYFNGVRFSFKAVCPRDVDCAPERPVCPSEDAVDVPIDYRGRDFHGLRRSLLDFASRRYPEWKDRLEADAGVMLVEVMSALGDELAYYQDRIARQAYLDDATERRSLRHHAALVDWDLDDGRAATTWLDVEVDPDVSGPRAIAAGTPVWAESDAGRRVHFEVGEGIDDIVDGGAPGDPPPRYPEDGRPYVVDADRNSLRPHVWDEDDVCLPVGATEMFVEGDQRDVLGWADGDSDEDAAGAGDDGRVRRVLLRTHPVGPGVPERRWVVRLTEVEVLTDPLPRTEDEVVDPPPAPGPVTRLAWHEDDALRFQLDLTITEVRANLLPASAGRTVRYRFVVGADPEDLVLDPSPGEDVEEVFAGERRRLTRAVERQGVWREQPSSSFPGDPKVGENVAPAGARGRRATTYLFSEPDSLSQVLDGGGEPVKDPTPELLSRETPLARLGETPRQAEPEIRLLEVDWETNGDGAWIPVRRWDWRRSLLRGASSQPQDHHFTLEHGTWRRVVGYRRRGREIVHRDYFSGDGVTVRFGDGEYGRRPARGTVFELTCRLGNGRSTNLAAGAIDLEREDLSEADALDFVSRITNPVPATGGADPEPAREVRQMAPEAFRALTFRAVRPEDYAEAADRLPVVQRAGATFRWTGSWTSAFVTPDPLGAQTLGEELRSEVRDQVDRFRQAGREARVADPRYVDIDLEITVCVAPDAYRGEVKERVREALLGGPGGRGGGFFSPDRFTFGTPLRRSRLEAAVQRIDGVRAVDEIRIRRRGVFDWRPLESLFVPAGHDAVLRLEHDPDHPDHGTLQLQMTGGA